jgi:hypothetical protein
LNTPDEQKEQKEQKEVKEEKVEKQEEVEKVEPKREEEKFSTPTEDTNDLDPEMSASKPISQEKAEFEKKVKDDGIMSIMYSAAKKVAIVGIVYFVGYMNWSVAWLICPLLLSVIGEQKRSKREVRRSVAKASAMANEKDVILARLGDLPSWVCFFPISIN